MAQNFLEMTGNTTASNYLAVDFLLWQQQGSLVLSPKFQRRPIWKDAAKAYFIDTLLRGFPVPALHLRRTQFERTRVGHEVIDGQQRLRALLEFFEGRLTLTKSQGAPWDGKKLEQLSVADHERLRSYRFPVFVYEGVTDATVLEIFSRINTYSVGLNAQELRNGKWFGVFKRTVYQLAFEYIDYWREYRIFTEGAIARMSEAQLVSELLVMQMDGIQDKKASINSFYEHLDGRWAPSERPWKFRTTEVPADWLSRKVASDRLRRVLDEISEVAGAVLRDSKFRRVPLFYSLFGVVYHRLFGLPHFRASTPLRPLDAAGGERLCAAILEISDLLSTKAPAEEFRGWRREFLVASARQTDNLDPRRKRLTILWDRARLGE